METKISLMPIKNLALGGFAQKSRWEKIHGVHQSIPYWEADKCSPEHAIKLVSSCPYSAINYNEKKHQLKMVFDSCNQCGECLEVDKEVKCLNFRQEHFSAFSELQAIAAKQVLDTFDDDKRFFISFPIEITAYCVCWGFGQASIVNDIGVLASRDIVAIETAVLDLIGNEGLMEKNIPPFLKHVNLDPNIDLHPFQRIWGPMKSPYLVVEFIKKLGMGSSDYELIEVLSPEDTSKSKPPKGISEKAPSFI